MKHTARILKKKLDFKILGLTAAVTEGQLQDNCFCNVREALTEMKIQKKDFYHLPAH